MVVMVVHQLECLEVFYRKQIGHIHQLGAELELQREKEFVMEAFRRQSEIFSAASAQRT